MQPYAAKKSHATTCKNPCCKLSRMPAKSSKVNRARRALKKAARQLGKAEAQEFDHGR